MDQEDPVIEGYLLFPPPGNVLNKITKKKTCQQKYCMLFNSSNQGIKRLEIYDNKEDVSPCSCPKIISLKNCIKIFRLNSTNINIVTKSGSNINLSTATDDESMKWLNALQSVAFKEDDSKDDSIDEDNDLYCSSTERTFPVTLCSSDASTRFGLEPIQYNLCISRTCIELLTTADAKVCASWPYKYIRRYGCRQGIFAFEAGRKCETGEGTFHFDHCNHQEIFRCLSMKIKSMKKKMFGDSLHSLDCGDQLQAALSMEPRSRSPLPLSSHSEDLNFNSISIKPSSTSSMSVDSQTPLINSANHSKPKPVKPPRKHIFSIAKEKFENEIFKDRSELGKYKKCENESVSSKQSSDMSYDNVEVRSDAWKTMGVIEINHREFSQQSTPDNNSIKLISRSQDNINTNCGTSGESKIIILPGPQIDPIDADYDRLQHFRNSRKVKGSDAYNVVVTRKTSNNTGSKDTWDDYDKVENVMQAARCADDSYLGYGMIRKASIPGPQVPIKSKINNTTDTDDLATYSDVDHCDHNGFEYAVVSKPKRV